MIPIYGQACAPVSGGVAQHHNSESAGLVKEWTAGHLANNGLIIVSDQKAVDKAKLKTDLFSNEVSVPKLRIHSSNR